MKFLKVFTSLCILLTIYACASKKKQSSSKQQKPKEWALHSTKEQPCTPRHEATFIECNDKFYLIGGRGIKPVSVYDPQTHSWKQKSKTPIELHHFQAIVYNEKIYCVGAMTGRYPDEKPVPKIYTYNPKNDTWSTEIEMPKDRLRGSTGAVVFQDKLYMVCGIQNGHRSGHVRWFDVYDFKSKTWTKLKDAPRARDHFQATVANNKLYVLAGRLSKAPHETFTYTIAQVDVYDFEQKKWYTIKHNLPTLRAGTMSLTVKDKVYVIGGESQEQQKAHNEVEILDTHSHLWELGPFMQLGRHGTGAILYKNKIYVASGSGNKGGGRLPSMEILDLD